MNFGSIMGISMIVTVSRRNRAHSYKCLRMGRQRVFWHRIRKTINLTNYSRNARYFSPVVSWVSVTKSNGRIVINVRGFLASALWSYDTAMYLTHRPP